MSKAKSPERKEAPRNTGGVIFNSPTIDSGRVRFGAAVCEKLLTTRNELARRTIRPKWRTRKKPNGETQRERVGQYDHFNADFLDLGKIVALKGFDRDADTIQHILEAVKSRIEFQPEFQPTAQNSEMSRLHLRVDVVMSRGQFLVLQALCAANVLFSRLKFTSSQDDGKALYFSKSEKYNEEFTLYQVELADYWDLEIDQDGAVVSRNRQKRKTYQKKTGKKVGKTANTPVRKLAEGDVLVRFEHRMNTYWNVKRFIGTTPTLETVMLKTDLQALFRKKIEAEIAKISSSVEVTTGISRLKHHVDLLAIIPESFEVPGVMERFGEAVKTFFFDLKAKREAKLRRVRNTPGLTKDERDAKIKKIHNADPFGKKGQVWRKILLRVLVSRGMDPRPLLNLFIEEKAVQQGREILASTIAKGRRASHDARTRRVKVSIERLKRHAFMSVNPAPLGLIGVPAEQLTRLVPAVEGPGIVPLDWAGLSDRGFLPAVSIKSQLITESTVRALESGVSRTSDRDVDDPAVGGVVGGAYTALGSRKTPERASTGLPASVDLMDESNESVEQDNLESDLMEALPSVFPEPREPIEYCPGVPQVQDAAFEIRDSVGCRGDAALSGSWNWLLRGSVQSVEKGAVEGAVGNERHARGEGSDSRVQVDHTENWKSDGTGPEPP